jgi:hypothetical protein
MALEHVSLVGSLVPWIGFSAFDGTFISTESVTRHGNRSARERPKIAVQWSCKAGGMRASTCSCSPAASTGFRRGKPVELVACTSLKE